MSSIDLSTQYLGLTLRNPLVVSACPLTGELDRLRRLEDSGAAAAVLPSLFQEQIEHEEHQLFHLYETGSESFGESLSYLPEMQSYNTGPNDYLRHIEAAKRSVSIPIIASLNGAESSGWIDHARLIQDAGADALELNIYFIPTDIHTHGSDVERRYLDLVRDVRESVTIPLAVKIGANFSSLPNFAWRLQEAGANGLVLFNRYLEPDIDLDGLTLEPDLVLSSRHEVRVPIRWIAILRDQLNISLAATSGIQSAREVLKTLLVGADVAMLAAALIRQGPWLLTKILQDLESWLTEREYESVQQLKGSMSREKCADPSALERANYMKTLVNFSTTEYLGAPSESLDPSDQPPAS